MAGVAHANRKADGPLTVAQRNALVEAWLKKWPHPLAFIWRRWPNLVRMAYHHGFTDDDINAACMEAGLNAARLFDPARGIRFTSFVCWHLRAGAERLVSRAVADEQRRGGAKVVSLSAPVRGDRRDDELVGSIPAADARERPAERAELAAAVWRVICARVPNPTHRLAVELRWGLNGHERHSLVEVGELIGVSRTRVMQIEEAVIEKCREDLERLYHDHCGSTT